MGSRYAPKRLELLLNQPKGFSFNSVPQTPTTIMFYSLAKLNNFQTSNIQCRSFHECGQLNMVSNNACCHFYFKCLSQIFTNKMNDSKFDFSKIFWEGLGEPLPRHLPCSDYALVNYHLIHARNSGFALNFRLKNLV